MNFKDAMTEELKHTYTENGAKAKNTTGDPCLDLFSMIGGLRDATKGRIEDLVEQSYKQDPTTALRTLFYARDIREGLGERDVFRTGLRWVALMYPKSVKKNISNIPEFGRWDDMYALVDTPCEPDMWRYMKHILLEDIQHMMNSGPISLLAKWIRTGNESSKKSRKLGIYTANHLGYSVYDFKRIIVKLRHYLDIVEAKMSANRWDEIIYPSVPSRASIIYRNAFTRHDETRYHQYLQDVLEGKSKIHSNTLYPYDVIREYWTSEKLNSENFDTLQALWDNMPDFVNGNFNAMVMADTSGSMLANSNGRPFFSAVGLAIYFAQRNTGAYHNRWMSFSYNPKYHELKGHNLYEILQNLDTRDWASNTNLRAAFELILQTAIDHNVPPEEIPKSLIVISDMEIDSSDYNDWSFYNYVKELYEEHSYTIPNVVFWNVDSRQNIFHADSEREGVQLVSGSSTATFKTLLRCLDMTPKEYMDFVLNGERYRPIVA